jgi:hypothetical protein
MGRADTSDALFGKKVMHPREPVDWQNRMAARSLLSIPAHRPIRHACDIDIPILLIVAEHDTQAPVGPALAMADRAPKQNSIAARAATTTSTTAESPSTTSSSGKSSSSDAMPASSHPTRQRPRCNDNPQPLAPSDRNGFQVSPDLPMK